MLDFKRSYLKAHIRDLGACLTLRQDAAGNVRKVLEDHAVRVAELMKTASTAEEKRSLLKEGKATWHGLEVLIGLSSELGLDTL